MSKACSISLFYDIRYSAEAHLYCSEQPSVLSHIVLSNVFNNFLFLSNEINRLLCAVPQVDINSSTLSRQHHAVFPSFLSDHSKQDAATTTAHSKRLISLLKEKKIMTAYLSTKWENIDSCDEQYRCVSALYLMPVLSQCYSIIIDQGISAPGHGK